MLPFPRTFLINYTFLSRSWITGENQLKFLFCLTNFHFAPQRRVEIKIHVTFSLMQLSEMHGAGRVNDQCSQHRNQSIDLLCKSI